MADRQNQPRSRRDRADAPATEGAEQPQREQTASRSDEFVPDLQPGEIGFTSRPHRPAASRPLVEQDTARAEAANADAAPTGAPGAGSVPFVHQIPQPHKTVEQLMADRQRLDREEREAAQGRRVEGPSTADTGGVTGTAEREE